MHLIRRIPALISKILKLRRVSRNHCAYFVLFVMAQVLRVKRRSVSETLLLRSGGSTQTQSSLIQTSFEKASRFNNTRLGLTNGGLKFSTELAEKIPAKEVVASEAIPPPMVLITAAFSWSQEQEIHVDVTDFNGDYFDNTVLAFWQLISPAVPGQ